MVTGSKNSRTLHIYYHSDLSRLLHILNTLPLLEPLILGTPTGYGCGNIQTLYLAYLNTHTPIFPFLAILDWIEIPFGLCCKMLRRADRDYGFNPGDQQSQFLYNEKY